MACSARWLAVPFLLLAATTARAALLPDSTVADAWRLGNGLEVRTRHVPRAAGVSITLAFRAGTGYEPAGQEGLSTLLAQLEFMGAAGDVPERTRDEMASLRPLGWESRVGTRLVRFTEIATPQQVPGVLQQFATRLSGITLTDASLKGALAEARRQDGEQLFGDPGEVLFWRAGALARGLSDERIVRDAGMPGLAKLTTRDVAASLHRWYQPGNASLAVAGNLDGLDVHALVDATLGRLAGGPGMPDTVEVRFRSARRVTPMKGLEAPLGVVACAAPALTDSLHPGFFTAMLLTGAALTSNWGAPVPPLTNRFHYSILDEPELVRFFPPVRTDATDPDALAGALYEQLQVVGGQLVSGATLARVRNGVRWLLGAELQNDLLARMRSNPGGLGTLSSSMATRALWHGDAFWSDYLARLDRSALGHSYFYPWLTQEEHQARLLLTPQK